MLREILFGAALSVLAFSGGIIFAGGEKCDCSQGKCCGGNCPADCIGDDCEAAAVDSADNGGDFGDFGDDELEFGGSK